LACHAQEEESYARSPDDFTLKLKSAGDNYRVPLTNAILRMECGSSAAAFPAHTPDSILEQPK